MLRLAVVNHKTGVLRYVTERGNLLEKDNLTPVLGQIPIECNAFILQINQLEQKKKNLQKQLSTATGSQKSDLVFEINEINNEISTKRNEFKDCINKNSSKLPGITVDVRSGVIASASAPIIFRPALLNDETYYHGGLREKTPVEAAILCGANKIYAIGTSKDGVDIKADPNNLLDIVTRVLDIALDEVSTSDLDAVMKYPVEVISIKPRLSVHDWLKIDCGLISINIDYGFMCASDTINESYTSKIKLESLADDITNRRKEICSLENLLFLMGPLTNPSNLVYNIRQLKKDLRDKTLERAKLNGALPSHCSDWWQKWECHDLPPISASPWNLIIIGNITIPAESPPPPL